MQNNPMNLQIQLVMPQSQPSRSGSSRLSGESARSPGASPAEVRNTLRRNNSIGSSKSGRSEVSTAASVASTSSGRRVTPLYNLSFHNILATTVSDAGTDQRVAKYSKKGVEIDGFGLLEPCELVTGYNDLATLSRTRGAIRSISPSNRSRATFNEDASVFSGVRSDSSVAQGSPMATSGPFLSSKQQPPTSFEAMTDEAKGAEANLGGKLLSKFKRFSIGVRPQTPSGAMTTGSGATAGAGSSATVMPGTNTILGKIAAAGAKPDSARPEAQSLGGAVASNAALVLHPPSGEIPQLVPGAGIADGKRTEGYYWTVRKWTRRVPDLTNVANESLVGSDGQNPVLANVWKRFNLTNRMGGNESHPPPGEIPVRFEWARESKRNRMRRARDLRASMDTNSGNGASRRGSAVSNTSSSANGSGINPQQHNNATTSSPSNGQLPLNSTSTGSLHPSMAVDPSSSSRPSSVAGTRSPRRSTDASIAGSSAVDEEEDTRAMDSGSESDPEDSETPWTCHLVLGPLTRIPIGTLSPAPHHPKLVGQLAVPFPLPDLSTTGLGNDGAGLTREELKDIIIVTCLHLIVRESFGGLGKKRKGDNPNGGIPWKLKSLASLFSWSKGSRSASRWMTFVPFTQV
ncbi:hypothetical protein IE53DRAFT_386702 [Violaceomyces palustris]|uniref:Uncharacterized protein n=1 Tax=Violaceomyces palustris TaxID=1673888 RepID=A0ACD0NZ08_9BASI|nr:hypothetical protein IE53DRAFT_386702 [Violaceomyces palustris]